VNFGVAGALDQTDTPAPAQIDRGENDRPRRFGKVSRGHAF